MQKSERDKAMPKQPKQNNIRKLKHKFPFSSAKSRLFPQFGRAGQNGVKLFIPMIKSLVSFS